MVEANHEAERIDRIREACQRKFPKLARWKRDYGARTVLVLEENDIQLTNQQVVADALLEVERTMLDRPDEVYLVSTAVEAPWWSFALRVVQRDYYDFSRARECLEEIDPATLIDLTGR
jgi:predicted RNA polymerase sigma factor